MRDYKTNIMSYEKGQKLVCVDASPNKTTGLTEGVTYEPIGETSCRCFESYILPFFEIDGHSANTECPTCKKCWNNMRVSNKRRFIPLEESAQMDEEIKRAISDADLKIMAEKIQAIEDNPKHYLSKGCLQ